MAVRRGSTFPVRPAAPIKGLSAGDGARRPPLPPQAIFLSTFSQVAPNDASLPTRPFLPAELLEPHREGGERKAFCRPGGAALVPELHFEETLTGATFRRRPLQERLGTLAATTGRPNNRDSSGGVRLFHLQGAAFCRGLRRCGRGCWMNLGNAATVGLKSLPDWMKLRGCVEFPAIDVASACCCSVAC